MPVSVIQLSDCTDKLELTVSAIVFCAGGDRYSVTVNMRSASNPTVCLMYLKGMGPGSALMYQPAAELRRLSG